MKNTKLSTKVQHYSAPETRKWKRVLDSFSLFILSLACFICCAIVLIYGNGQKLQHIFIGFAVVLGVGIAAIIPAVYSSGSGIKRWQFWVLHLGFLGGVGVVAVAAFLILDLQRIEP